MALRCNSLPADHRRFNNTQVIYSDKELKKMLGTNPSHEIEPTEAPGIFLNRMNSMRGLSDEDKAELLAKFRDQRESYGTRASASAHGRTGYRGCVDVPGIGTRHRV